MKAKILAALTNREVLELMEERGASNVDLSGTPNGPFLSECKVHEYLATCPAATQNSECIVAFLKASKKFNLLKAEVLQLINLRPSTAVEVYLVIEDCESRLGESKIGELLKVIEDTLPPAPQSGDGEDEEEGQEEDTEAT